MQYSVTKTLKIIKEFVFEVRVERALLIANIIVLLISGSKISLFIAFLFLNYFHKSINFVNVIMMEVSQLVCLIFETNDKSAILLSFMLSRMFSFFSLTSLKLWVLTVSQPTPLIQLDCPQLCY